MPNRHRRDRTKPDAAVLAAEGPEIAAPPAAGDEPFSELIARWLDDGDRMTDAAHAAHAMETGAGAAGGAPGAAARLAALLAPLRSERARYRTLLGGAAIVALALVAIVHREAGRARPAAVA